MVKVGCFSCIKIKNKYQITNRDANKLIYMVSVWCFSLQAAVIDNGGKTYMGASASVRGTGLYPTNTVCHPMLLNN